MIQDVISYLNNQVKELNCFATISGLCEMTTEKKEDETEMIFPVIYKGKDNLKAVTDFEYRSGLFFHIKNGDTNIEDLDSPRAEYNYLRYTTPLRAYGIIRRSIIDDSEYTHEKLAVNITHAINDKNINSLKATIGVNKIDVKVNNWSTNREEIEGIFQNVEFEFRHNLSLIVVEYDIILEGYQQCFTNYSC